MTALASEEERWLRIGLLAGIDNRSHSLDLLLTSTSHLIDSQIATLEKAIEAAKEERQHHEERFLRLGTSVSEAASKWSLLLKSADTGDTPFRGLERYTNGLWIVVALVGLGLPSFLSWSQHDALFEALPAMLLAAIGTMLVVQLCAPYMVSAERLRRIASHDWTLGILATLVIVGTLVALSASRFMVWANVMVTAAIAGVTWTCWLVRRRLSEPVLSDFRRRLEDARDTTARMEREQRQRLDALEQAQTDLYAQVRALRHEKQMLQRKVSEGYLLGVGLGRHSHTSS